MNVHYRAYLFTKGLVHAVKNDNMEMVQWLCCEYCPIGFVWKAAEVAVALGRTRVLEWLATRYDYVLSNFRLMDVAVMNGRLETLQWLHTHVPNPPGCSHAAMNSATRSGHLPVITWLIEQYPERTHERFLAPPPGFDKFAPMPNLVGRLKEPFDCSDVINNAPYSESFELFEWTHDHFIGNDFELFSGDLHDYCSLSSRTRKIFGNCHFDKMVRSAITFDTSHSGEREMKATLWLHERYPERWSANAMDFAATNGNLNIVKWLHDNRIEGCSPQAMAGAAENGHLHVIEWLHANRKEVNTPQAVNMAAKNGHLHLLKWLHEHEFTGFETSTMDEAAMFGHLDIVEWLHETRSEGCTQRAMNVAAGKNHLEVVKWLHENKFEGCSSLAMYAAAHQNHLEMVKWLHENRSEGCTTRAMDEAASANHLNMVKWLHANRSEGCTTAAMDSASSYEMVEWLDENRIEGHTNALVFSAASKGDFKLVQFVIKKLGESHIRLTASSSLAYHNFEIFQWLHEIDPAQVDINKIRRVMDTGHDGAVPALLAHMQRTNQID